MGLYCLPLRAHRRRNRMPKTATAARYREMRYASVPRTPVLRPPNQSELIRGVLYEVRRFVPFLPSSWKGFAVARAVCGHGGERGSLRPSRSQSLPARPGGMQSIVVRGPHRETANSVLALITCGVFKVDRPLSGRSPRGGRGTPARGLPERRIDLG